MTQSESVTRQTNAEILAAAYRALAAGDVPAVLAAFSQDITWHISGRNPLSRDYAGLDEVVAFFHALGERSNGTFELEVHDILDGGDTVVALVTEKARRGEAVLADAAVHVWRFEDERAVAFRAFTGDEHAQDAFWA